MERGSKVFISHAYYLTLRILKLRTGWWVAIIFVTQNFLAILLINFPVQLSPIPQTFIALLSSSLLPPLFTLSESNYSCLLMNRENKGYHTAWTASTSCPYLYHQPTFSLPPSIYLPLILKEKYFSSCLKLTFLLCSCSSLFKDQDHVLLDYLFFFLF